MADNRKNFPQTEEEILKFWQDNKIFEKTLEKESPKGTFVFYEGPPTANGKPGIHHILARAFKDIALRYKTMQGYHVPRRAGWDTHGLPVELQVEKELGISGKPEIEKYGVEEFNKKCRESVWTYKDEWERMTQRMGFWLDMENAYVTYEKDYIETLWSVIKTAHERDLLYLGHKVVPHCPRCGTALSSHEVAQGYKKVTEPSVYVKFKLKDEDAYVLSWTTTPWTLPGNVALAVGKDIVYAKVQNEDGTYYIAKDLYDKLIDSFGDANIVDEVKGSELVGREYDPLFEGALDPGGKKAFYVAAADFVTTEDGTGVVHTAVMYGEDDYQLGEQIDLPKVHTVDENGNFADSVTKFAGMFVKDEKTTRAIIDDLKERGLLFKEQNYTHDYPFCWRCDTPLLYYAKDSWFIRMSELREDLIKENETVNWVPDFIKRGRFGEWLEGLKDWAISRERYWGTPLPVWVNADGSKFEVIGSYEELAEKSGKKIGDDFDPHKPYIDDITFTIDGEEYRRDPAVMDVWFDSGCMPFAQEHYPFENKERIDSEEFYPADYICEAIDQTRGWFYTMLAVSSIMGKTAPYKNVVTLGHILDKQGKKMSKSKGNIVDPWEIMSRHGVDSVRYFFYTVNQPGEPIRFDPKDVENVLKKNFLILWNVYTFYQMYADEVDLTSVTHNPTHILDRWILSRMHQVTQEMTQQYDAYDFMKGTRQIGLFIDDLSTWYLRRSRDRLKGDDQADKEQAVATLRFVLQTLAKLMAPSTPFFAEDLYRHAGGETESVHLADWPNPNEILFDAQVIDDMATAKALIERALAARVESKMKVRQALGTLYINKVDLAPEYLDIIADEVNVKEVAATKDLPKESDTIRHNQDAGFVVALDVELTDDLIKDGIVRELTRQINSLRKEMGLTPQDMVDLSLETDNELISSAVSGQEGELKEATKLTSLEQKKADTIDSEKTVEINGSSVWIGIKR